MRRTPPQVCWELRISRELTARDLPQAIKDGLDHFIMQASAGHDLRPFLSATINDADYQDLMFYDWGVYHFHLGTELETHGKRRGFIKGTDNILFAIAAPKRPVMYLLDVHPHRGGFTNQRLLHVVEQNWPEILDPYTAKKIAPSYKALADGELDTLRRAGVNVLQGTPGGRTLIPMGGGITGKKTSVANLRAADHLVWRVRQAEAALRACLPAFASCFEHEHGISQPDLTFRLQLLPNGALELIETKTGISVWREPGTDSDVVPRRLP